jgi:hypothetical protein
MSSPPPAPGFDSTATLNPIPGDPSPAAQRRWFQFSLRSFLGMTLAIALLAGWLVQGVRNRLQVVHVIERLGGDVSLAIPEPSEQSAVERWLQRRIPPQLLYPVRAVSLNYAECQAADLRVLRHCPQLVRLDLDFCTVGDEGVKHLEPLKELRWLDLQQTGVTDQGVRYLTTLTSLHSLILEQNAVSDASVPVLGNFASLRYLRIGDTQISPAGYQQLRRDLPDCRIVYRE